MIIEQLILVLLVIFALYTVFAANLKRAIIGTGVFGVWMAFMYLLYHAPDVALAEAVISGSLGTILYIITIKNYDDISVRPTRRQIVESAWIEVLLMVAMALVIYFTMQVDVVGELGLLYYFIEAHSTSIIQVYPITEILLDFRLFDTVFEALMLLVSGVAVAHFIKHQKGGE